MKTPDHSSKPRQHLSFERMLFFSDAVFAIAITLLVIEIKVPVLPYGASEGDLGIGLLQSLPKIVGFLVSFLLIGQSWIEHHRICGLMNGYDQGFLWNNLLLLLFVAWLPFATAVLSEFYWLRIALYVYALSFAGLGLTKAFLWRHAVRRNLLDKEVDHVLIARIGRRVWASPATSFGVCVAAVLGVPYAYFGFMFIPLVARILDRSATRQRKATSS